MRIIDHRQAQSELDSLIDRVHAGEDIRISRDGTPLVRLVPVMATVSHRQRGTLEGQGIVPDSFFDPLPADEIPRWAQ